MAGSALNFGSSQDIGRVDDRITDETVGRISTNQTIYVSLTGNDTTGDGTDTLPFATVTRAFTSIDKMRIDAGVIVTILIKAGFYEIDDSFFPRVDDFSPQLGDTTSNVIKSGSGYLGTQVHPDIDRIVITGEEPTDRRFINLTGDGLSGNVSYEYETEYTDEKSTYVLEFCNHKMSCVVGLCGAESITDLTSGISYASIYCNELSTVHEGPSSSNEVGDYKTFFRGGPRFGRGWGINPSDEGLSGTSDGGSAAYPYDNATNMMSQTSTGNNGETPRSLSRYFVLGCHEIAGVCASSTGVSGFGLNLNNNNHIITKDNYAVSSEKPYDSCSGAMTYGDWCPNVYMDDYDRNENIFAATMRGYSGANGSEAIACGYSNAGAGSTGTVLPSSSDIFDLTAGLTQDGGPFLNDENIRIRFHGTVIRRLTSTWSDNTEHPAFTTGIYPPLLYIDNCSVALRNMCLVGDWVYSSDSTEVSNTAKTCIDVVNGGQLVPQKLSIRQWNIGVSVNGAGSTLSVTGRWSEDQATGQSIRGTGDLIISKCERGVDCDISQGGHIDLHNVFVCGCRWLGVRSYGANMVCYKTYVIGTQGHAFYCAESHCDWHHCYTLWSGQMMLGSLSACIQKWGPDDDDFPGYSNSWAGIDYNDERNGEITWRLKQPYAGTNYYLVRQTQGVMLDNISAWTHKHIRSQVDSSMWAQRSLFINSYGDGAYVSNSAVLNSHDNAWYIQFWPTMFDISHMGNATFGKNTIRGHSRLRPFYSGTGLFTASYNSKIYIYSIVCDETIGLYNVYVDGKNHTGDSGITKTSITPTIGSSGFSGLGVYSVKDSVVYVNGFGGFYLPRKYDFYIRQRGKIQILDDGRGTSWNYQPNPGSCYSHGISGAKANRLNPAAFNIGGTGSIQSKYTGNTRADMSDVPDWDSTDDINKNKAMAFGDEKAHIVTTIPHFGSYWAPELTPREEGVAGQTGNTGGFVWIQDD